MDKEIVKSEKEMSEWFVRNYEKFGYSKILRKDIGIFLDFMMEKDGKEVRVELETFTSNFILHKHKITGVDELVCITKDVEIGIPTFIVKQLDYRPRIRRISATVDPDIQIIINSLLKDKSYRNKSHVIETAIRRLAENEK